MQILYTGKQPLGWFFISGLTAVLILLGTAVCPGAENLPSHNTKDTRLPPLKIAASIDNIPFHFVDERGRAVGIFIDLWRLWSKKTGRQVEFIPLPWARSLEMVKAGRADIHAGCFFSTQRDEYLDYAAELRDCQTHFFFSDSIYGLKTLKDLNGFQIGLLDKDYASEFVSRELPGASIKKYNSHEALFHGVESGEIKVFVCDTPTALYFLTRNRLISKFRYHPSRPLYRKPFFAAVRQGNTPLIRLVNQGLSAITREERAAIERKWMGRAPVLPKNRLIIGVDQSFPPFSMRSAEGEPSGFLVDYWQAWAKKSGKKRRDPTLRAKGRSQRPQGRHYRHSVHGPPGGRDSKLGRNLRPRSTAWTGIFTGPVPKATPPWWIRTLMPPSKKCGWLRPGRPGPGNGWYRNIQPPKPLPMGLPGSLEWTPPGR